MGEKDAITTQGCLDYPGRASSAVCRLRFMSAESCLAPLLQQQPLPEWSLLALYIAEIRGRIRAAVATGEQLLKPAVAAAGAASPVAQWGPYVSSLQQQPGTVLEWTEEEVRGQGWRSAVWSCCGAAVAQSVRTRRCDGAEQ